MSAIVGIVRGGRIELDQPLDLPDGTEIDIPLPKASINDDPPMTPEEIERTLAAMEELEPLDIPPEVVADLEAWERKINQDSIDNFERGVLV